MKTFEYAAPDTLKEATALLGSTWGKTEVMAGGTDLVTCLKQGLTAPDRVVSLRNIKDLRGIKSSRGELRIGAMTTLADLTASKDVQKHFPSLVSAATGIGSAQMINVGTVGGDLCQRPRCWYYRNGYGLLAKDGNVSLPRQGDNRYHSIFATEGDALFVSASSLGPALVALGATIVSVGPDGRERPVPAVSFFQVPKSGNDRETTLKPNEVLTEIRIPMTDARNATYEVRHRHGLDWPYVSASVAFELKGGVASNVRIVLGHVAPLPWPATRSAGVLNGNKVDEAAAAKAGDVAGSGAKPLSGNAYKVQLAKTAVKRAILAAAA